MSRHVTLDHKGQPFARLDFSHVNGSRGVAVGALDVQLRLDIHPTPPSNRVRLFSIEGGLFHDRAGFVAVARVGGTSWESPENAAHGPSHVHLSYPVRFDQVRELDELRAGAGGVGFHLRLAMLMERKGQIEPTRPGQWLEFEVAASEWVRVLGEMRWEDRATFEVPVRGGKLDQPPFDDAARCVREAIARRDHHLWSDAAAQCREALDALETAVPPNPPVRADWANQQVRDQWTIAQRLAFIRQAVRHATHVGHHRALGDPDAREARLLVALTGLLLKYEADG